MLSQALTPATSSAHAASSAASAARLALLRSPITVADAVGIGCTTRVLSSVASVSENYAARRLDARSRGVVGLLL